MRLQANALSKLMSMKRERKVLVLVADTAGVFDRLCKQASRSSVKFEDLTYLLEGEFVFFEAWQFFRSERYLPSEAKLVTSIFDCFLLVTDPQSTDPANAAFLPLFLCGFWLARLQGNEACIHIYAGRAVEHLRPKGASDFGVHLHGVETLEELFRVVERWFKHLDLQNFSRRWLSTIKGINGLAEFQAVDFEIAGYAHGAYATDLSRVAVCAAEQVCLALARIRLLIRINEVAWRLSVLVTQKLPSATERMDLARGLDLMLNLQAQNLLREYRSLIREYRSVAEQLRDLIVEAKSRSIRLLGLEGLFTDRYFEILTAVYDEVDVGNFPDASAPTDRFTLGVLLDRSDNFDAFPRLLDDLQAALWREIIRNDEAVSSALFGTGDFALPRPSESHPLRGLLESLEAKARGLLN